MIRIEANDQDLELSSNTSLVYVRVNPLFTDDVSIESDRSFNFKIPCTAKNLQIIDNAKEIGNAALYVEGRLYMRGTLYLLGMTNESIDVSIVSSIYTIDLDLPITELAWDTTIVSTGAATKDAANAATLDASNFVFPVIRNVDATAIKAINGERYLLTPGSLINQELLNSSNVRVDVLSPQFGLKHILTKVIEQSTPLALAGDFINTISGMLIYNNTLINSDSVNFVFEARKEGNGIRFTIPSRDTFDIAIGDVITMEVNGVNNIGSGNFTTKSASLTVVASHINTPGDGKVNVANFLTDWGTELITPPGGVTTLNPSGGYFFDFTADEPYLFIAPANITGYGDIHYANIKKIGSALYEDVNAKNHLPNITTGSFLKAIKDFFCLSIVPNYAKDELVFVSRKDLMQTSLYKDYTSKLLDYHSVDIELGVDYRFIFNNDTNDQLAKSPEYTNYATINAEHDAYGYENKSIDCATTNTSILRPNVIEYPVPYVAQPIRYVTDDYDSMTLRLLNYRGFRENTNNFGAVYSADTVGLNPNEIYSKYWRDWYSLFRDCAKIYKFPMLLSADDILGIDPEKKWKVLHHNYLWKEVRTNISMKHGIEVSEVHCVKIEYPSDVIIEQQGGEGE